MPKEAPLHTLPVCRTVHLALGVLGHCHSSACVEIGGTRVLCCIQPPQQLVQEYRGTRGRVSCTIRRSSFIRNNSVSKGRFPPSIDEDLGIALEGVAEQLVMLEKIPQLLIEVVFEIVNEDGALWDALSTSMAAALSAGGFEMVDLFSSCSAALMPDGSIVMDPNAEDEFKAVAATTVCMALHNGGIAFTSHRGLCEPSTIGNLMETAAKGIMARKTAIVDQIKTQTMKVGVSV